jgi:hypothetical protein
LALAEAGNDEIAAGLVLPGSICRFARIDQGLLRVEELIAEDFDREAD